MENKPKNIFDELDKQNTQLDDISEQLGVINTKLDEVKKNQSFDSTINNINSRTDLIYFIKTARKEYIWFGSYSHFYRGKNIAVICYVALIIVGLISSIVSSIAFKMYSTFTFIENIWLIFAIIMLVQVSHLQPRMLDLDLMEYNNCKFIRNEDNTYVCTNIEKKRYRWTRRISYLAAILNIICAWVISGGTIAIVATIFELIFIGLTAGAYFSYINAQVMFGPFVLFTNKKTKSNEMVTIVFDTIKKRLISIEEFNSTYNKFNN